MPTPPYFSVVCTGSTLHFVQTGNDASVPTAQKFAAGAYFELDEFSFAKNSHSISLIHFNIILAVPAGHGRHCHVLITLFLVLVVRCEVKKSRDIVYGTQTVIKFQQNSFQL